MELNTNDIPQAMQKSDSSWIIWEERKDPTREKPLKIPLNPKTRGSGETFLPGFGSDLDTAIEAAQKHVHARGIGFIFNTPEDDNLIFIDLDDCIDEQGVLSDFARTVVDLADSYTETSPSGKGLHIFGTGSLAGNRAIIQEVNSPKYALYSKGRYSTVTTNVFENRRGWGSLQKAIDFIAKHHGERGHASPVRTGAFNPQMKADILGKLKAKGLKPKDCGEYLQCKCPHQEHKKSTAKGILSVAIYPAPEGGIRTYCFACKGDGSKASLESERLIRDIVGIAREAVKFEPLPENYQTIPNPITEENKPKRDEANEVYNKSNQDKVDEHPYLKKKGVKAIADLRIEGDKVVFPIYFYSPDGSKDRIGIQMKDEKGGVTTKGVIDGGALLVAEVVEKEPIILCEGYATAKSVAELSFFTAACCFGLGNMLKAALMLRQAFPENEIVCSPDYGDHREETKKMRNSGFRVIKPSFKALLAYAKTIEAGDKQGEYLEVLTRIGREIPTNKNDFNDLVSLYNEIAQYDTSAGGDNYFQAARDITGQIEAGLSKPRPMSEGVKREKFQKGVSGVGIGWEGLFDHYKTQAPALDSGLSISKGDFHTKILFPSGALTLIAAQSGHGKTSVLLQTALNAAKAGLDKVFLVISAEEEEAELKTKLLGNESGLGYDKVKSIFEGKLADVEDMKRVKDIHDDIFPNKIRIAKKESLQIGFLIETLDHEFEESDRPIGGVFVDYAQRLEPDERGTNIHEDLGGIVRELSAFAREKGVAVILATQFNRSVDSPEDVHRRNIGSSFSQVQEAALILGLWKGDVEIVGQKEDIKRNQEKYGYSSKGFGGEDRKMPDKMLLKILKARSGAFGALEDDFGWVEWNGKLRRIQNTERQISPSTQDSGQGTIPEVNPTRQQCTQERKLKALGNI